MSIEQAVVSVGAAVPDFEMETYNPAEGEFGKLSLAELKKKGRWALLVFYPADFTFVCYTESRPPCRYRGVGRRQRP
jgi:peroxiredoxin (alkyl hydroperoxide reductase subunit C)